MKTLLALITAILCAATSLAATDPREAQLESLKKQFPAHTAGAVTDQTDPLIRDCYLTFRNAVDGMAVDSLPADVGKLRDKVERQISKYISLTSGIGRSDPDYKLNMRTPSMRAAVQQNLSWLKVKVRPYVARLESLQRGRGR